MFGVWWDGRIEGSTRTTVIVLRSSMAVVVCIFILEGPQIVLFSFHSEGLFSLFSVPMDPFLIVGLPIHNPSSHYDPPCADRWYLFKVSHSILHTSVPVPHRLRLVHPFAFLSDYLPACRPFVFAYRVNTSSNSFCSPLQVQGSHGQYPGQYLGPPIRQDPFRSSPQPEVLLCASLRNLRRCMHMRSSLLLHSLLIYQASRVYIIKVPPVLYFRQISSQNGVNTSS